MFQDGDECVASFTEIQDKSYLDLMERVRAKPSKYPNWCIENGMLYINRYDKLIDPVTDCEEGWKMLTPEEHCDRVLREAHCIHSAGHLGIEKTYDRVASEDYWRGAYHDVFNFVRSCEECHQFKVPPGLMSKRIVERPWSVVACDLMEFPSSSSQNKYFIVF